MTPNKITPENREKIPFPCWLHVIDGEWHRAERGDVSTADQFDCCDYYSTSATKPEGVPGECQHDFRLHMIEMPQGYSKPGITKCVKCGQVGTFEQACVPLVVQTPDPAREAAREICNAHDDDEIGVIPEETVAAIIRKYHPAPDMEGVREAALYAVQEIQTLTRLWVESEEEQKAVDIIMDKIAPFFKGGSKP